MYDKAHSTWLNVLKIISLKEMCVTLTITMSSGDMYVDTNKWNILFMIVFKKTIYYNIMFRKFVYNAFQVLNIFYSAYY